MSPEQELEALKAERQQLLRTLEFHERDRQLLAFEIHDGIVQDMTAAGIFLSTALEGATFAVQHDKDACERGLRILRDTMAEARRLIQGLIPVVLDERGMVASLEKLVERFRTDQGLEIGLTTKVNFVHLMPAVEMVVLRIVQEALNNVWRHSQSNRAEVRVTQTDDDLRVGIQDFGVGFDPTQVKKTRYGLTGMRERARLFGGTTEIDSSPGKGTRIIVTLPLADAILQP
ncbi:MAG: sensor histidine kinase [Planctomycetales bacterium]|nr:sensor histidine kinase [Planctomycetales bacterium]